LSYTRAPRMIGDPRLAASRLPVTTRSAVLRAGRPERSPYPKAGILRGFRDRPMWRSRCDASRLG